METSRVEEECTYLKTFDENLPRLVMCFIPDSARVRSSIKVIHRNCT